MAIAILQEESAEKIRERVECFGYSLDVFGEDAGTCFACPLAPRCAQELLKVTLPEYAKANDIASSKLEQMANADKAKVLETSEENFAAIVLIGAGTEPRQAHAIVSEAVAVPAEAESETEAAAPSPTPPPSIPPPSIPPATKQAEKIAPEKKDTPPPPAKAPAKAPPKKAAPKQQPAAADPPPAPTPTKKQPETATEAPMATTKKKKAPPKAAKAKAPGAPLAPVPVTKAETAKAKAKEKAKGKTDGRAAIPPPVAFRKERKRSSFAAELKTGDVLSTTFKGKSVSAVVESESYRLSVDGKSLGSFPTLYSAMTAVTAEKSYGDRSYSSWSLARFFRKNPKTAKTKASAAAPAAKAAPAKPKAKAKAKVKTKAKAKAKPKPKPKPKAKAK